MSRNLSSPCGEIADQCCTISIGQYLSHSFEWKDYLATAENPEKEVRKALKVNVYLLIKWLLEETEVREAVFRAAKPDFSFAKIMLCVNGPKEIVYMAAVTDQIKEIMKEDSVKPELKELINNAESFSSSDLYWPSRWFLSVSWKDSTWVELSKEKLSLAFQALWSLHQIEELCLNIVYLKELSHYVGLCKDLRVLNVEGSNLQSLPCTLQLCENLEELLIRNNNFLALPGFVLHMPKLKKISRQENRFRNWYASLPVEAAISDELDRPKNPGNLFCTASLCALSAMKVAKSTPPFHPEAARFLEIPKNLKYKVYEMLKDVSYCDNCRQGTVTDREGYKITIVLDSLLGYTHIPVEGIACSYKCAIEFSKRLDKINLDYRQGIDNEAELFAFDVQYDDVAGEPLRRSGTVSCTIRMPSATKLCRQLCRRLSRLIR